MNPMGPLDIYDYIRSYKVMKQVKIATLKSELSRYLRRVQAGAEVVVTDRKVPIVRIIPYDRSKKLVTRPAQDSPRALARLKIPSPPTGTNSLKALREERAEG